MKSLISLTFLSLLLSCNTKNSSFPESYSQQEIEDIQYVMSLSNHDENFIYDHSDDRQHRYFLAHLKRQGFTSATNPALFRSIKNLRSHHQKLRSTGKLRSDTRPFSVTNTASFLLIGQNEMMPVEGTGVVSYTMGDGVVLPVQLVAGLGMIDDSNATATALSSIPDTAYYSQNSIQLFNDSAPLANAVTKEAYYGGEDLKAISNALYSGSGGLTALMSYYYKMDSTSQPVTGQFTSNCKNCIPTNSCPSFKNIEPIGDKKEGGIIVCTNRRSDGECTYRYVHQNTHDITFPVKGVVTFVGKQIKTTSGGTKVDGGTATMWITNNESGGGCQMSGTNDFFGNVNTNVSGGNILTWDFEPADFGSACFSTGESVNFVLSLRVPATDGTQMCAYVSNSNLADTAAIVTYTIGPMTVYYGCLAEGSLVTMKSGLQKAIENVGIGEKVLTKDGGNWTVTSNTRGFEPVPSIKVITKNEELVMTQEHPVVTDKGVVIAKVLKSNMKLFTPTGEVQIERIESINYDGRVWNLNLGQLPGEEELLTDENSTFYANNLLVGDSRMQHLHSKKHRRNKKNVLAFLPKEWHEDYLNYIKKGE